MHMGYGEIIQRFYSSGQYYALKNQEGGKHLNNTGIWALAEGISYSRMIDGYLSEATRIPARDAFIGGYMSIPALPVDTASIVHLFKDLKCLDSFN